MLCVYTDVVANGNNEGLSTSHLHDSTVLAAIQREQLVGVEAVWRDGGRKGGCSQLALPLEDGVPVLHLFTAKGVRERGLQRQQLLP